MCDMSKNLDRSDYTEAYTCLKAQSCVDDFMKNTMMTGNGK